MEKKKGGEQERIEFWRLHIGECRKSGLSYAEYARRHDLKDGAFGYWRKKFWESSQEESAFVELKVPVRETSRIEVVLRNHIRITVGSDFDATTLKKLVGVLQPL
jgi:transposase-like protein